MAFEPKKSIKNYGCLNLNFETAFFYLILHPDQCVGLNLQ